MSRDIDPRYGCAEGPPEEAVPKKPPPTVFQGARRQVARGREGGVNVDLNRGRDACGPTV